MSEPAPWEAEFDALVQAFESGEVSDEHPGDVTGVRASPELLSPEQLRAVARLLAEAPAPVAPSPAIKASVLGAIRADATAARVPSASSAPVVPDPQRRRIPGRRPIAAIAAAVAAIVAALVTFGPGAGTSVVFAADLVAAPGSPSPHATGTAKLVSTKSGLVMRLHAEGLAPNPAGAVYQCWYVGPDDTPEAQDRVAIGTFRTKDGRIDVSWATALDPVKYPKVGITLEPDDGNPLRTGVKVMVGVPTKGTASGTTASTTVP